ncbi:MAG: hypothetical protein ABI467_18695 [Kofleriaceae bacterium]
MLVFSQMFVALSVRDTTRLFWEVGALGNLVLLLVTSHRSRRASDSSRRL